MLREKKIHTTGRLSVSWCFQSQKSPFSLNLHLTLFTLGKKKEGGQGENKEVMWAERQKKTPRGKMQIKRERTCRVIFSSTNIIYLVLTGKAKNNIHIYELARYFIQASTEALSSGIQGNQQNERTLR